MAVKNWIKNKSLEIRGKLLMMMKCIWSGQQLDVDGAADSSESLATRDYSASGFSSKTVEMGSKMDESNIEEAESSLRESGYLNYEEARALLGRLEYHKGNIEAALYVYEGIDVPSITSKIKVSLSRRSGPNRPRSESDAAPTMSLHAISLLLEAIFLKTRSLQRLGRFEEAVQSCRVILDTIESALPEGLPETLSADSKLHQTLNKAVELLPELCKFAGASGDVILSYRRALLYRWNLEAETTAKIQKEFAIFLLYSGVDAKPPNLRSQTEGSFVPRNNVEEAVLLLLILLRKSALKRIAWDPSILDHLSYASAVLGESRTLALQFENLQPSFLERKEIFFTLALCYYSDGQNIVALNLLRNLLNDKESRGCVLESLLASRICGESMINIQEGLAYTRKAIVEMDGKCSQIVSAANCLRGILLSAEARSVTSDEERSLKQSQALEALETAEKVMVERDPNVVFHLCLENAEQRKLEIALHYGKQFLKLEAGSNVKGFIVLARILSAQKRYIDAETVINVAIDQTGKWEQCELLRTKAKLEVAQGQLKNAIETYTHLLALLQIRHKSFSVDKKRREKRDRSLEAETWHDLADAYTSLARWRDAELCLLKSKAIDPYSANRWYSSGFLNEAKGLHREALNSYQTALDIEPTHVQSLISTARILRQLGSQSLPVLRSLLTDAIRLDRTNHSAWYNLGLVYVADTRAPVGDSAECFEAAAVLEETAPIEPFR